MPDLENAPRKKLPKELAVIDADNCTGCEACIEVCPVDCIVKIDQDPLAPGLQSWCEIDWGRCIGCKLCIRIPRKKSELYDLVVCPWDAIEMVPVEKLAEAAERMGGPPHAAEAHRPRLLAAAQRQVDLARGG
jgi:electron transport complex protein RnfB